MVLKSQSEYGSALIFERKVSCVLEVEGVQTRNALPSLLKTQNVVFMTAITP